MRLRTPAAHSLNIAPSPLILLAGAGGDAVSVPRAAALAAAADTTVLPAERLRLLLVADVAALEAGKAKAKAAVKHGGVFVCASVADGSRLPLDGIPMTLDSQKHYKMNGVVFGVAIGDSKGCITTLSRNASAATGFPDKGSSFKKMLCIEGRDVEVTFKVTGSFEGAE